MIKILGIDPSQKNLGLVKAAFTPQGGKLAIIDMKLISTEKGSDTKQVRKSSDNLRRAQEQATVLREWEKWADIVMSEIPHGSQSASAMFSYGVCIGLLAWVSRPLIQISATETKKAAVGRSTATKREMIEWAEGLYPSAPWLRVRGNANGHIIDDNEHLADAIGVIHAGLKTAEFRSALSMLRTLRVAA
jgi:Holliday junction resolvasome RuvABC endonuclease subunit